MGPKIRLGISACLLGLNVRYDGGHKLDARLVESLSAHAELVPVCPESEAGLGVPREPMRLAGDPLRPRVVTVETGVDRTGPIAAFASARLASLAEEGISGFVFKGGSPSCGPGGVGVLLDDGREAMDGTGIFARAFVGRFPRLPVSDEGRLRDPAVLDEFIRRLRPPPGP